MERRRLMGKLFAYIVYSITNVNKKYGNSSFVNPLSMSGDGIVTYTSNNTAVATIDNNGNVTIIAPGEAIITASVEDTLDFEYENNSASYTLIVAKADGNVSEPPTPKTIVYDGDDHQLINAGIGTGTILYKFDYDEEWDEIIPTASESGTYTILYKSSENQYYTESSIGTVDVTIQKALSQYTAPTRVSPLVYNTNAQNLLNEGSTNDGLIWYSTDEINWSTNIPQGTDAGEYTVYWKLVGDYNHTNISSTLITVEMDKVTPTVIPPIGLTIYYDGDSHELVTAGSTDYGTLKYSLDGVTYSTSIPTASAMDDYTIYYKIEGNSNVNDIEPLTVQASISGIIVLNPTINLEYNLIDYDGTAKQPSVEVLDDNGNIIPSSEYTVTYSDNVNVGTATVTITDVTGGTYIINGTKTFTINSIDPTYTAPTAKTGLVYNGDSQLLLNSGSVTIGGTMLYSSDGVTWSENNNYSETNAGTYDTYWKIIGDDNYNDIGPTLILVTIDKAPVCLYTAPTYTSPTYNCNALNLLNAGSVGCGIMLYSSDNSTWSTTIPQGTNAGTYTSYWRIVGDNNHYGVDSTFIQTDISKCTVVVVVPTAKVLTYNGSAQVLANAGSVTSPSCANGMEYSLDNSTWSSSVPSATNGGAYTVYYRVQGNSNINGVSGNIACSIGEKSVTATVTVSPTSYDYDKTAKLPTVTVKDGNTTIPSSEYTVTYSNNVNAGTATVTITDKTGGNWNVIGSTTFTINKRVVTLTWGTLSWTYDGSAHSTTCTAGNLCSGDSCTVTLTNNSITNKGTTTVTASSLSNSNYTLPSGNTATLTISARAVTYKANDETWTYDGSSHSASNTATLTSGSLVSGHSATFSCSGSVGAGVGSATKTLSSVTIKSGNTDVSGNYAITRNNGTLKINAKSISIPTPTNYSGAYDGGAHTATFGSATGASITKYRYSTNNSSWTESTSNPSLINVGTLYTLAYYTASTNYTGSNWSSSATITISRAKTASASAANKTYNGTTETNGTAQTGVSGSYVSWSGTTSATNAGGYTAYATPDSNHAWSDGTTGQKTISWTMSRRGQNAPTLNAASAAFHGTATASIKSYGTVANGTAQAPGSIVWENQSRTALGSQNARAYHAATTTNFSASGWSSTVAVTITCANDLSVSVTRTNRTWNNSAQVLASATSHGCTYYLGFGSSTTSAPSSWGGANSSISATNVGTYYIWYKATKDGNHCNDIGATYSGTAVISKSDNYSITAAPTVKANTYNGQALTLLQGGSASIAGSFSYSTYTNAATGLTGTWTFTPTDSAHYNSKSGSVSGCYINRAAGWTGFNTTGVSIVYSATTTTKTGTGASGTLSVSSNNTGIATVSISGNTITATRKGYGTATITVTAAQATNYNQATSTFFVVCNKANGLITCPTAKTLTYNGSVQLLVNAGSSSTGTVYYNVGSGSYGTGIPTGASGTYTIHAYAAESTNYYQSTTCTINVTISKYTPIVTLSATNRAYNGLPLYATATVSKPSGADIEGEIYYGTSAGATTDHVHYNGSTAVTLTGDNVSVTNVGSVTVYAYFVPHSLLSGCYNNSPNSSITLTVSKANQSAPSTVNGNTTTYATSGSISGSASGGGKQGTLYYKSDANGGTSYGSATTTAPSRSRTSVGTTTFVAYWGGNSNYNASGNSSLGKLIVNRTDCPGPTVSGRTVAYNRSALALATVSGNCGTMHYRLGTSGSWTTSIPTATDIGAYTVYWYMDASTNYNGKGSSSSPAGSVTGNITTNYINLGLPSGTLWSYTNIGSANEGSYGNYYMYGLKTTYSSSATPYSGMENPLSTSQDTAYNYSNGNYSFGSNWRTPTAGQLQELVVKCTITAVTANGLNCFKFTGPNGNYIIIPRAGSYNSGTLSGTGDYLTLWSSTPSPDVSGNKAFLLNYNSGTTAYGVGAKTYGRPLRPVYFNSNTRGLNFVDLGLPSGTLWADKNVGAGKATDAGTFFKYGVTSAYLTSLTPYSGTASIIGTSRDQARAIWGGTWHLPTSTLITELFNNTTLSILTVNGVKCLRCTCKTVSTRYILFPLVGYYYSNTGNMTEVGNQMRFWSGTPNGSNVYIGVAHSTGIGSVITEWTSGLSVRAVL